MARRIVIGRVVDEDTVPVAGRRVVIGYSGDNGGAFVTRVSSSSSHTGPRAGFLPILPVLAASKLLGKKKRKTKNKDGAEGEGTGRVKLGKRIGEKIKKFGKDAQTAVRRLTRHDEPEIIDVTPHEPDTTVAQVGALLMDTDGMRRRI